MYVYDGKKLQSHSSIPEIEMKLEKYLCTYKHIHTYLHMYIHMRFPLSISKNRRSCPTNRSDAIRSDAMCYDDDDDDDDAGCTLGICVVTL